MVVVDIFFSKVDRRPQKQEGEKAFDLVKDRALDDPKREFFWTLSLTIEKKEIRKISFMEDLDSFDKNVCLVFLGDRSVG